MFSGSLSGIQLVVSRVRATKRKRIRYSTSLGYTLNFHARDNLPHLPLSGRHGARARKRSE